MQIPQVQEFLVLYNFSIPILRVRSLWWPKEMKVGRHISRWMPFKTIHITPIR
ncbi:hypothetical protein NC652_010264 [Populus alba x Populus x berolinensis]|uniref:Uncharacterized protein n=1 Tax=Populus alba x Populus x berolinensis TaxID=444605 RepID=A0AAD6QZG0_9ROSI|nr:hypothetical protein NC652_010264 [Populus alba x Populus x berolinensis]KAJ6999550.1 hypothetical protein NC653_010305 [Populus alba x Populus x berolinensis]